jgi:EmrB/QacA subfamily drug resistance transporter
MRVSHRTSHKNLILVVVASTMLLGMMDGSIVNVALPTLVTALNTSFHLVEWAVLSFLLGMATLTLSMGRLGDVIGKKRVFLTGVVIFLIASALCGTARGIYSLIVFRFVQSVGAAMMTSLGVAIVSETWPAEKRATALGIAGGILSLGGIAGPALGGWIIHFSNWRWIFLVNLPIGVVSLALGLVFLPPLHPHKDGQKFDFIGALFAGVSMCTFVLGMTFIQTIGLWSKTVAGWMTLSAVASAIFVYVEHRVDQPMLDLSLFHNPRFTASLVSAFATFISLAGVILLFPFYLQLVGKLEQQQVGMVLAVAPIIMGIWGPFSGMIADRFGARRLSLVGLIAMSVGYALLAQLSTTSTPTMFVLLQLPMALGMATFSSSNNAAIMTAVPRHRLGIANGMLAMSRTAGTMTGVALLGTFFYVRLEHYVGHRIEVTSAPAAAIVRAQTDQFHLAAVIAGCGAAVAMWQVYRERNSKPIEGADPNLPKLVPEPEV